MNNTLLSIDDVSLPLRKNACLHPSKPKVRREPVLAKVKVYASWEVDYFDGGTPSLALVETWPA